MIFILPFFIFMAIIFFVPLGLVFFTSVVAEETGILTLKFFHTFFSDGLYLRVLWTTIEVSFLGALIVLLFGYPVAYYLAKQPAKKRMYLSLFILLPFFTSILVKSFAFVVILGHSGAVNWVIRYFLGDDLAVQLLYNRTGLMFGIVHDMLPFIVFPILVNLLSQNSALQKSAEIMGASRTRIFWQVTFPLSLPGVFAGLLLVVVRIMGQFVTPSLLGGRTDMMMANLVSFHVNEVLDWSMASVISVVLCFMSGAFLIALARLRGTQFFGAEP
jgi:putative spermidine/putrescine transport system permease protein